MCLLRTMYINIWTQYGSVLLALTSILTTDYLTLVHMCKKPFHNRVTKVTHFSLFSELWYFFHENLWSENDFFSLVLTGPDRFSNVCVLTWWPANSCKMLHCPSASMTTLLSVKLYRASHFNALQLYKHVFLCDIILKKWTVFALYLYILLNTSKWNTWNNIFKCTLSNAHQNCVPSLKIILLCELRSWNHFSHTV